MNLGIININDIGIQVALNDSIIDTSPGYAVIDKDKIYLGMSGRSKYKSLPTWRHNRFWSETNTETLPQKHQIAESTADLVFLHIQQLWDQISAEADKLVIAVPSSFGEENLGLLLGMCEELKIPLACFVDASIAEAAQEETHSNIIHIEIHLHSLTLTQMKRERMVSRQNVRQIESFGLSKFIDSWTALIAEQSIKDLRIDPIHKGESEQELFNKIPLWINEFRGQPSKKFSIESEGRNREISISLESVMETCATFYQDIAETLEKVRAREKSSLIISSRLNGFPGFMDSLYQLGGFDILTLSNDSTIKSINKLKSELLINNGGVKYFTKLPGLEKASETIGSHRYSPTHMVWKHQAIPIKSNFDFDADINEGPQRAENPVGSLSFLGSELHLKVLRPEFLKLNGKRVNESSILLAGDRLNVRGTEILFVSELNDGEG